ncbi:Exodeoxyribonuclease III [Clostridiaceae bacterium JG1575]|nr:Exodeoxyribonuclease III [Clostridiaceae bacterium JG1575]
MKIVSWNVNGLRAIMKKEFAQSIEALAPDVLFLQEIKMQDHQLTEGMDLREMGYCLRMHSAVRKGYSGVAVYSRLEPDAVYLGTGTEFDEEGRVIRLDFGALSVYGIYFPNGGRGEERMEYKMRFYEHYLAEFAALVAQGRHVVICGDFNVAHEPIDLANPKSNEKNSGFLPIERDWFTRLLGQGFVDVYRRQNPDKVIYTWWDQRFRARDRNVGWRIDYFVVNEALMPYVKEAAIYNERMGSDHCPLSLTLDWPAQPAARLGYLPLKVPGEEEA